MSAKMKSKTRSTRRKKTSSRQGGELSGKTRTLDPPANQKTVMCHYCGYEPAMAKIPEDGRCPKCRGASWEQFIIPRRIFAQNG